ncbi:MAG: reverse transcriptase domain-containing protein, partial [Candidatus Pacebacteria bacterium]|nr:reverse transcriptase domain-containing protein [Candidatus Paceibacterota bacterium]
RTIELLRIIRNKKGLLPVQLRSDRRSEFMSNELQLFLRQHGIEHTAAPPYTPQLNGSVERLNRTLIESVRCALHESGAPKWCWAEAIRSAAIVLNHTLVREGKTPIQLWHGIEKPPPVSHFKPWGSDVMVYLPDVYRADKLSDVATRMAVVGYEKLGYRVMDLNCQVRVTREVHAPKGDAVTYQVMHAIKQQGIDEGEEEEEEEEYFGRQAELNEMKLMKMISLEAAAAQPKPISTPPTPKIPSRSVSPELPLSPSPSPEPIMERPHTPAIDEGEDVFRFLPAGVPAEEPAVEIVPAPPKRARRTRAAKAPPAPSTRPTRQTRPPVRYGMASPGDIGQGLMSESISPVEDGEEMAVLIEDLEEALSELMFPFPSVEAFAVGTGYKKGAPIGKKAAQELQEDQENERIRTRDFDLAVHDQPTNPDEVRRYSRKGEIITPSHRCCANSASGVQCKLRTCNGAFCWRHLLKDLFLVLKKSLIPQAGKGVFAGRDFAPGEAITMYTGDIIVENKPDTSQSKYMFQVTNDIAIDAARRNAAPGRLINDSRGTGSPPNLEWIVNRGTRRVHLKTTRAVKKGEEFYVPYGAAYWRREREIQVLKQRQAKKRQKQQRKAKAAAKAAAEESQNDEELYAFFSSISSINSVLHSEPRTIAEARLRSDWPQWKAAIEKELNQLVAKGVWIELDQFPSGANIVDGKWVFKLKGDGTYKARWVAKGFKQRKKIDYDQTFAATLSYESLRL